MCAALAIAAFSFFLGQQDEFPAALARPPHLVRAAFRGARGDDLLDPPGPTSPPPSAAPPRRAGRWRDRVQELPPPADAGKPQPIEAGEQAGQGCPPHRPDRSSRSDRQSEASHIPDRASPGSAGDRRRRVSRPRPGPRSASAAATSDTKAVRTPARASRRGRRSIAGNAADRRRPPPVARRRGRERRRERPGWWRARSRTTAWAAAGYRRLRHGRRRAHGRGLARAWSCRRRSC